MLGAGGRRGGGVNHGSGSRREGKSRAEPSRARSHAADVRHREGDRSLPPFRIQRGLRAATARTGLGGRGQRRVGCAAGVGTASSPAERNGTPISGPTTVTHEHRSVSFTTKNKIKKRSERNAAGVAEDEPLRGPPTGQPAPPRHLPGPGPLCPGSPPGPGRGYTHRPAAALRRAAAAPGPVLRIGVGRGCTARRTRPGPASRSCPGPGPGASGRAAATKSRGKCPDGAGGAVGRAGGYRRDGGCITRAMCGESE